MLTMETATDFIKNFFEENPDKNYWDCTRAFANHFEIEFATAFVFVSDYVSKKLKVK